MKRTWQFGFILLALILLALLLSIGTALADFGVNWAGQFYNCKDLGASCGNSVVATATYTNGLNFIWSGKPQDQNGAELSAVNKDGFSVRFTSSQTFQDANYEFRVSSDDGARVYVDGVVIIDAFVDRTLTTNSAIRTMTAGSHSLVVEFFDNTDNAELQFQYFIATNVTPVASSTPIPVITAQVERVNGLAFRTGPYLGASLINVLRPGKTYNVLAKSNAEGLFTWYQISTADGQIGWSSGRYLSLSAEDTSVPEISTIFETIGSPGGRGAIAVPRSIMNIRIRPSTRTAKIGSMPWGGEAELLARTVQAGKDFWYLVRYNGVVGWIYAPFVGVRGDINNVPVI